MPVIFTRELNGNVKTTQRRPLADLQRHGLRALRFDPEAGPVGRNGERHRRLDHRRLGEELVVRPEDLRLDRPLVRLEADELDGELVLVLRGEERVRRVVRRRPDPPAHVRHAEAREEPAVVVVHGRERHGHVHHDRVNPLRARQLPERRPAAVVGRDGDLSRKKRRDEIPMKVKRAAATQRGNEGGRAAARASRLLSRIFQQPATRGRNASRPSTAGIPTRFPFPSRKSFFPSSAIANSGR